MHNGAVLPHFIHLTQFLLFFPELGSVFSSFCVAISNSFSVNLLSLFIHWKWIRNYKNYRLFIFNQIIAWNKLLRWAACWILITLHFVKLESVKSHCINGLGANSVTTTRWEPSEWPLAGHWGPGGTSAKQSHTEGAPAGSSESPSGTEQIKAKERETACSFYLQQPPRGLPRIYEGVYTEPESSGLLVFPS